MAIAYDSASQLFDNAGTQTVFTLAHTITGSNTFLVVFPHWDAGGGQTISSVTWNGTALTQAGTPQAQGVDTSSCYILKAPETGTYNIVVTISAVLTGSKQIRFPVLSYTGAHQTSQPDSVGQASFTTTQSHTINTTVVASNCWLAGYARNDAEVCVAGTGTTSRIICNTGRGSDSNGVVSTGSQGLNWTTTNNVNGSGHVISINPVASAFIPTIMMS